MREALFRKCQGPNTLAGSRDNGLSLFASYSRRE